MTPHSTVVLVAHAVHDHGGMERAFAELVRRASPRWRFVVVATELADDLVPLVEWQRVRVPRRPFPIRFVAFFGLAGLRVRSLRRRDAVIVHALGAIIPNRVDVATVPYCHAGARVAGVGRDEGELPWIRRANNALTRVLGRAAERFCFRPGRVGVLGAVSDGLVDEVAHHYPAVARTMTPNGVDVDHFHPDPAARARLRAAEGVGDDEVVVLFVGGQWARKGLPIVLDAVAALDGRLRVWVVGHGDERWLARRAESLRLTGRVRSFGPQPDTAPFDAAADCFVLPSRYETFSLVAFEAAAAGLPLVVAPVHGARELVEDGRAGRLVARHPAAVAGALRELAEDPELRRRLGTEARERASAWTWARSVAAVEAAYRGVAGGERHLG